MCDNTDPLYGAVLAEETLLAPAELSRMRSQDLYVSDRILAADPGLGPDLAAEYGADRIERWSIGLFCTGWDELAPGREFQKEISRDTPGPGARLASALRAVNI